MADEPSHPLFAAMYDPLMATAEAELFPPHREYLSRDLSGRVLDVGAGTGAMFPYLRGTDAELHAVEPDLHMRTRAERRAADLGVAVDIRATGAESLPYPDDHFDVVMAAVVFCTIPDPETALDEVARVLQSGGEFRFLEHVHDTGWNGRLQSVLEPVWRRAAGGCRLTRETGVRFTHHEAFEVTDFDRYELGLRATPVRPMVRGTLLRRDGD